LRKPQESGLKSPDPRSVAPQNLARFEAELVDFRARLERLEDMLLPPDRGAFLAVVAEATQGAIFSAAELRAHAAIDPALAATLARFRSSKALGVFLRELASGPVPGAFVLERVLRERTGWLWRVSARE
jgi:hypothetical protein